MVAIQLKELAATPLAEAGPKTTISLQLESIPGGDKDCVSSLPNGFAVQQPGQAKLVAPV